MPNPSLMPRRVFWSILFPRMLMPWRVETSFNTPAPPLFAMTLPAPACVPPMTIGTADETRPMEMPSPPFPSADVLLAATPIRFPVVVRFEPSMIMPSPVLPATTLPAPAAVPPNW